MRSWVGSALGAILFMGSMGQGSIAQAASAQWNATSAGNTATRSDTELFADGTAYAAHGTNVLYKSKNDGRTWTPKPGPDGAAAISHMSFANPELGYVSAGGKIFRTADGGGSWDALPPLPKPPGADYEPTVDGLEAIPSTRSVLVSGWVIAGEGCEMRRTDHSILRFQKGTWREVYLPYPALVYEIELLDSSNGLVLAHKFEREPGGDQCNRTIRTARSFVLLTRDGGRTFQKIHRAGFVDEEPVMAVAMPAEDRIILGRRNGSILISRNGGKDFRHPEGLGGSGSLTGGELDALTFPSTKIGYAGTNGIGIWRTTNGGWSWTLEPSPFDSTHIEGDTYRGSIAAVGKRRAVASGPGSLARREQQ